MIYVYLHQVKYKLSDFLLSNNSTILLLSAKNFFPLNNYPTLRVYGAIGSSSSLVGFFFSGSRGGFCLRSFVGIASCPGVLRVGWMDRSPWTHVRRVCALCLPCPAAPWTRPPFTPYRCVWTAQAVPYHLWSWPSRGARCSTVSKWAAVFRQRTGPPWRAVSKLRNIWRRMASRPPRTSNYCCSVSPKTLHPWKLR